MLRCPTLWQEVGILSIQLKGNTGVNKLFSKFYTVIKKCKKIMIAFEIIKLVYKILNGIGLDMKFQVKSRI